MKALRPFKHLDHASSQGEAKGGNVPLLHTAKNNIQSAGIKARPQNITHTHTKEDLKTMSSRWKQTQDCLRFPRMLF